MQSRFNANKISNTIIVKIFVMRPGRGVVLRRSTRTETLSFYSIIAPAFVHFLARYPRGEQVFRADAFVRDRPGGANRGKRISSMTSFKVNFVHRGATFSWFVLNAFASIVRNSNERTRSPLRDGSREGLATWAKNLREKSALLRVPFAYRLLPTFGRVSLVCILKIKGYCSSKDMAPVLKLYLQRAMY